MKSRLRNFLQYILPCLIFLFLLGGVSQKAEAQELFVTILAVNSTEFDKEKDIVHHLPPELTRNDILDTDGLKLDYDYNAGAFVVTGKVALKPKETKKYRVRVRDVWQIQDEAIGEIKQQINQSLERIEGSEHYDTGLVRSKSLNDRLDYIVEQQNAGGERIETRIDKFRAYSEELDEIRGDALSVSYWKTKPPSEEESRVITFFIEIENPFQKEVEETFKSYLPSEIKPENIVETQGFDIRYDPEKRAPYLEKEEKLGPRETKQFQIGVIDVWRINQDEINSIRTRTEDAVKDLASTKFKESAEFLAESIYKNLTEIEESQAIERGINEHISAYRANKQKYERALADVKALEQMLIEKSKEQTPQVQKVKNLLKKVKQLSNITKVVSQVFSKKQKVDKTLRIIIIIISCVGVLTLIHFVIWGRRSAEAKLKLANEEEEEEKEKEESSV